MVSRYNPRATSLGIHGPFGAALGEESEEGMIVLRTRAGLILSHRHKRYRLADASFDELINRDGLLAYLQQLTMSATALADDAVEEARVLAPIGSQEVWAAGVTYYRSRDARMEEARESGGGSFYDRVYSAERPELFFKATPHRVAGPGQDVRIRKDSGWNVPEPELTLAINSRGTIVGYTIGNDMSSRDIEGENPLYLPQAKVYDGSCALGPGILVTDDPLPKTTRIVLSITRNGTSCFEGSISLSELKRQPRELVDYLFRASSFPAGCFLMTGTGIVPPTPFTLQPGDEIAIAIEPIGTLTNRVTLQD
jgi:2-dehydro-3-deoxy-D-arabinonate dehydratase